MKFKKIIAFITAMVILSANSLFVFGSEFLYGDVDRDGIVTAADAAIILQHVINPQLIQFDEDQIKRASVNEDTEITAANASSVLQKTQSKEFKFEVETETTTETTTAITTETMTETTTEITTEIMTETTTAITTEIMTETTTAITTEATTAITTEATTETTTITTEATTAITTETTTETTTAITTEVTTETTTEEYKISEIKSVKNDLVRVTLNRPTNTELSKDAFSIICTGGGKDMTILSVSTNDNQVYNLTTAYYNDNTYNLQITLSDGTRIYEDFESKYDCPDVQSISMRRMDETTAKFIYSSDTPGEFYYMIVENSKARSVNTFKDNKYTPTYIINNGVKNEMLLHQNEVVITNLAKDVSYTFYYAARGIDLKTTLANSLQISGEFDTNIPDIKIEKSEAFERYFIFTLNKPTETKLKLSDFSISCPASGTFTLGKVESNDNKVYKVYMEENYHYIDNNTLTVTITIEDNTVIKDWFYADYSAPVISDITIKHDKENAGTAQVKVNEAGKLYYKILDSIPDGIKPKDPAEIYNSGKAVDISYGINFIDISDIKEGQYFCCATEDKKGNRLVYYNYKKIPSYVPEEQPGENDIIINNIEATTSPQYRRPQLNITFNKEVSSFYQQIITRNTSVSGGNIPGKVATSITYSGNVYTVVLMNVMEPLMKGEYIFHIEIGTQSIDKKFTVE